MTREIKLSLLLGFALILAVGVLISDHLSAAHRVSDAGPDEIASNESGTSPGFGRRVLLNEPEQDESLAVAAQEDDRDGLGSVMDWIRGGEPMLEAAATEPIERATPVVPELIIGEPIERPDPIATDPRTWPTHRVGHDESLWKITERYYGDGSLWRKLARHNEGRIGADGTIQPGTTLFIPPGELLGVRTVQRPATRVTPMPSTRTSTYRIQRGDTLIAIARRELGDGERWREIAALNERLIPDVSRLPVGVKIRLPAR